ncbi:hypothetical protein [Deinococcus yavapaiensis]|uniref:PKD domain-containing protein n=1 Tax=Deinococcus yavapaiensis KR-236 TaxID=694435 RepID=A0A318SDN6_9DEIO|nr:hypothetical protein [Deinococcus yavapaiensis]PYE55021.1 hypothetical protein DES52_104296 [Deinococcus yavapaiensis KR-236]
MKNLPRNLALSLGLLAFTACSSTSLPNPTPPSPNPSTPGTDTPSTGTLTPIIKPSTRVLEAASREALTQLKVVAAPTNGPRVVELRYKTVTPFLAALKTGDVLVSEPSAAAPSGFLLHVESVRMDGATLVVTARDAKLTEAIEQGEVSIQESLKPERLLNVENLTSGVSLSTSSLRPQDLSTGKNYNYHLSLDHVFYDQNGKKVSTKGHIDFNLDAGITLKLTYDWIIPTGIFFRAGVGVYQDAKVQVSAQADAPINESIELQRLVFEPIIVSIGPVPLVFVPTVALSLDVDGHIKGDLTYELIESVGAGAAVQFDGEFSKDFKAPELKFEQGFKKVQANADLKAGPKVKVDFLLYGLAGATATAQIYGHAVANYPTGTPQFDLDLCAKVTAGVNAPMISDALSWSTTVFDKCADVVTWTNKPPVIEKFTAVSEDLFGGPDITTASNVKLCAVAKDEDDAKVALNFTSSKESLPAADTNGCTVYRFKTTGPRTLTVTATDSGGMTAVRSLTLDVKAVDEPVPTVSIQAPTAGQVVYLDGGVATTYLKGTSSLDDCKKAKWTSSNPADALSPDNCGAPIVTFNSLGTRTLTLTATNGQGESGKASVTVNVQAKPASNLAATASITKPATTNGQVPAFHGDTTFTVEALLGDPENDNVTYKLTLFRTSTPGDAKVIAQGTATGTKNGFSVAKAIKVDTFFGQCSSGEFTLRLEASDNHQASPTVKTQALKVVQCPQ